jgi:hypothetical protein
LNFVGTKLRAIGKWHRWRGLYSQLLRRLRLLLLEQGSRLSLVSMGASVAAGITRNSNLVGTNQLNANRFVDLLRGPLSLAVVSIGRRSKPSSV